jgi:hypothetical protein
LPWQCWSFLNAAVGGRLAVQSACSIQQTFSKPNPTP